jgi:protein-disulfide isomerase
MSDDDGRPRLSLPVGPRDHLRGSQRARVTLLEYGDFECPQCALAYPVVEALRDTLDDRLRVVFRNFPLTNAHPNAQRAAEAAEWAASLGMFWPMHDALYDQQARLSSRRILELAGGLALDPAALEQAWAAHTFFPRVKEDYLSGLASEVTGTPTFFIDGRRHDGPSDLDSLRARLEDALEPAGHPPAQRSG